MSVGFFRDAQKNDFDADHRWPGLHGAAARLGFAGAGSGKTRVSVAGIVRDVPYAGTGGLCAMDSG